MGSETRGLISVHKVFFVDSTGALCSKASGHAIDVLGTLRLHPIRVTIKLIN